jgi:hypothetical protein
MTLIEVLAALIVLTLSVGVLVACYRQVMVLNAAAELRTTGAAYAAAVLEDLKVHPERLRVGNGADLASIEPDIEVPAGISVYADISSYDEDLRLYRVEVHFGWINNGRRQEDSLITVLPGGP